MSRKPKLRCPAERWEAEARQWKACAVRLAKLCADLVGCCWDEERTCPEGLSCSACWLNRAVRETAGKDASRG
jgi:hypothetical protein